MRIVEDKKYPDMYRIQWPNGDISVGTKDPKPWEKDGHYGFYNKTRAKEFLHRKNIENYKVDKTYKGPVAHREGRGCV